MTEKPADGEGPPDKSVHCGVWAAQGECEKNAVFMLVECAASCRGGVSKPTSIQAWIQACAPWVAEGECYRNPAFMLQHCKTSCESPLVQQPPQPQDGSGNTQPTSDPEPTSYNTLARYFRRDSWSGLNASARGNLFMEAAPKMGIRCPKVGLGYFYYPSLHTELRGAVATANIARGEEVCFVPLQQLLCEFSVGNSSMLGLMRNYFPRNTNGEPLSTSVTMKAIIALFVIREGARESSRWMPFIKGALDGHDPNPIPTNWARGDPRLAKLSAYGQKLALQSRTRALRQYTAIFPEALSRYAGALGEGMPCTGRCSQGELAALYSQEKFLAVYSVLRARDWVLDMHGEERPFLAPVIDLLNFGQVGIRASYDDKRQGFAGKTVQPIKAGQELLFYYGNFCIDDSVSMYGFAPESAPPCKASGLGKKRGKGKAKSKARNLVEFPASR